MDFYKDALPLKISPRDLAGFLHIEKPRKYHTPQTLNSEPGNHIVEGFWFSGSGLGVGKIQ